MKECANKTVVVTGAAVGIGYATALKFAENGANVVLLDLNEEKLAETKADCEALGAAVLALSCDVGSEESVNAAMKQAADRFGRVDILVNNAAIWREMAPFEKLSVETWERYLRINVMSVVFTTRAVLPAMKENHYGRIVNVASVTGIYGLANMTHYSATKAAVIAMSKALAKEVAKDGIVVNAIAPGTVTPSHNRDVNAVEPNDMSHSGRTGSDRENAELIYFLCGDKAPYLTGQNIAIDGGRHII